MQIRPLASSSKGNAYIVSDGQSNLLLECGLPFEELKKRSDYEAPMNIHACLISHAHQDHSRSVKKLLKSSVDCYMLKETSETLGVQNHYRTKTFEFGKIEAVGSFVFTPLKMFHDVPCAGFLIASRITGEKLLFATDTILIKYDVHGLDYIMIEANYDVDLISDDEKKSRTIRSHMNIDTCIDYLKSIDLSKVKKIYLMHLSERNSDAEEFKRKVQAATGKITVVCEE